MFIYISMKYAYFYCSCLFWNINIFLLKTYTSQLGIVLWSMLNKSVFKDNLKENIIFFLKFIYIYIIFFLEKSEKKEKKEKKWDGRLNKKLM